MSERTLVTGFGPFLDVADNPSAKLARSCGRPFEILEVAFAAVDEFLAGLDATRFDRLLLMGVADGREFVTPELFARNVIGRTPDVRGTVRYGKIEEDGPALLNATLWTPEILTDFPLEVRLRTSMNAGRYLCNYSGYRALQRFPEKRVGFLHVPSETAIPLEEQSDLLQRVLVRIEAD